MPVTVLYEDDWGPGDEFKLHHFVCQCVIDRLGWTLPLHQVRTARIQGLPIGGDSNLRQKCLRDLKKLSDRNHRPMRDRVFTHCAYVLSLDARARLLDQLPDLNRLVSRVAECLKQEASEE